jgi:hypothetical protein
VVGEIALPELVLDEPVGGRGVGYAQERLGQDHEGSPSLVDSAYSRSTSSTPPSPARWERIAAMRSRAPRVDAPLALGRQPRPA